MLSETPNESLTGKHTSLAHKLLDDAEREIAAGDLVQGSEKLWGATSQALKAYCASHGMPHGKYAHRRRAAFELATRLENPSVQDLFGIAQACHSNFYHDWMYQEDLDIHLPGIRELVQIILQNAGSG